MRKGLRSYDLQTRVSLSNSRVRGVLLENAGFDELVNELLHAVEHGKEALGRHDNAFGRFRLRRGAIGGGLKSDKVEANHVAREVDLTNAISVDFFFHFGLNLIDSIVVN